MFLVGRISVEKECLRWPWYFMTWPSSEVWQEVILLMDQSRLEASLPVKRVYS